MTPALLLVRDSIIYWVTRVAGACRVHLGSIELELRQRRGRAMKQDLH